MAKDVSPLDALDQKFLKEAGDRRGKLDAALGEVREVEKMLAEAKDKARRLQQDNINASFAHDTARAELVAKAKAADKAA